MGTEPSEVEDLVPGRDAEAVEDLGIGGAGNEAEDRQTQSLGGRVHSAMRRALQRRRIAAMALIHQAFGAATRGRTQEKTLRSALTLALSQKALECHLRHCNDLGEQEAVDLGPESLKLQAAGELFALWVGAAADKECADAEHSGTAQTSTESGEEESKPPTADAAADAASVPDGGDEAVLTETMLQAALTSMELPPTQTLVDEFIGGQSQPPGIEDDSLRRAEPVSLNKSRFIARLFDIVNPDAETLVELESRRWAPWSLFGFSCDCLPWGSTKVVVSDQGDLTVQRSSRALLCHGGYRSVDIFDATSAKWLQVRKNLVHSSAVAVYLFESLLLFMVCATFFHGHYATMTAVSSLAALGWMLFRIAFMVCRKTSSATIYSAGLPRSLAGGSAGSFEIPRADCRQLLDAFIKVKLGKLPPSVDQSVRYECPRPAVFFAERWIKLNSPHSLEIGTGGGQHYMIEKVADASPPGCRSFSQTTWHTGLITDIPWIHTHLSERELGTLCRWLLKGLIAAISFSFLVSSCFPECIERSPCDDDLLNAKVGRLPPFSNVSATDCKRPFDFSGYESFTPYGDEEEETTSGVSEAEMLCNRRAALGHCSPTHPSYRDMIAQCRPICGECLEDEDEVQLTCDERCREFSCSEFTCGTTGMRRKGDTVISQIGIMLEAAPTILYGKTCSFAGGGTNDGICDEAVGWCLPGTDYADCEGSQNYIDNLYSQYIHTDTVEHQHLHWYAPIAEANEYGCRHVTVLERCAACRSANFACSAYNTTSGFPDVRESCLHIKTADVLYKTPWCQAAAAEQMFPSCSCLPPHLRALPNWRAFVAVLAFTLAVIWIPTFWRWATYKRCFTEFGAVGVDTTKSDHPLKFHTLDGTGKKIALHVMEQKLGRPLNHELIKTYEYTVPTLRKPFNVGKQERLHVHADYLLVETVAGRWACNFWTRSPARDSYFVLLDDTSFVESGEIGEPSTSQIARFLLALGFTIMFSSYVGGILSYAIKRWQISPGKITLGKWFGLAVGLGSFLAVRAAAGSLKQQFLHVGCVAGGTARGRRNPHGGLSPFYVQIRGQSDADIDEIKEVIRATRRESKAVVIGFDSHPEDDEPDGNNRHVLSREKSQKGLRNSMKDIEQQVKDGLLEEHATVMTAKDITLRAIEDTYQRLDTDNSGALSADEIASAISSLGIEMEAGLIMKKWDTDRSGSLERAEFFSMMLEILDPKSHITEFSAPEFCPMKFYGMDFDWLPWGQRITQLSRVQCDLQGKTGFGGLPLLVDHQSVEIEVPRMRWLMLNQNPASMSKFNSYLAEALTLYTLISQLKVLAHQEPRTTGSIVALAWLAGRLVYLLMRARASVHIHATGVPPGTLTKQHKGTFPVELQLSNPLIGEFLQVKGATNDAPTTEIVELVEPRFRLFTCQHCPGRETHRMLLIGDSHFAFEKVAGDHRTPRQDTNELAEPQNPQENKAQDLAPEPFDVANKRLLLAPARTYRRRVLAGLTQDLYWVAMSRRSCSLRKFASTLVSSLSLAFFFALPIALISSQTDCKSTLNLYEITAGREYDTSGQFPSDQLDQFWSWCEEFPVDLGNPMIPSACASLYGADFTMIPAGTMEMFFNLTDEDYSGSLSTSELEVGFDFKITIHQQRVHVFGNHRSVSDVFTNYDENANGLLELDELQRASLQATLNRRLDPQQYVKDKEVWCKQFGEERGNDPCECNWWRHHLPDMPVLASVWGVVSFFVLIRLCAGVCRKQRFYAEMGIAGVPNQAAGHMAKLKIPEEQMDAIPFRILESRLGRKLRKKELLKMTYKPKFECCRQGQLDVLHIHEDYVHLETLKGRCFLKRMMCCRDASKMETDDYYVLLRDTGFVEIVENNSIAKVVVQWCLILTLLSVVVDVFLKWFLTIPNPGVFDWSASQLAMETLDVTVGRASRIGIVLLPVIALIAYWIGAKLRHGYIHIGVRPGGTHRGFVNRFGSTSPFYFRVRASSELEVHGDTADKPCATGKFHEPYISVVHTLRSARAGAQQMDTLVTLKGQLGAGTSWHGKDTGRFAQGSLNAAALVLGAAPVIVEFVEGDLESQALEKIGDAAIEMEDVATSFFSDDQ